MDPPQSCLTVTDLEQLTSVALEYAMKGHILDVCPFELNNCTLPQPFAGPSFDLLLDCKGDADSKCKINCPGTHFELVDGAHLELSPFWILEGATEGSIVMNGDGTTFSAMNVEWKHNAELSEPGAGAIQATGAESFVFLQDCIFRRNSGYIHGGAVSVFGDGTTLISINSRYRFNKVHQGAGGGAIFMDGGSMSLTNDRFIGNEAIGVLGGGGAVLMQNSAGAQEPNTFSAQNVRWHSNKAKGSGGAVFFARLLEGRVQAASFVNCRFEQNEAYDSDIGGGAVAASRLDSISFEGSILSGNKVITRNQENLVNPAVGGGGAIQVLGTGSTQFSMVDAEVLDNEADGSHGGAIASSLCSDFQVSSSVFIRNRSTNDGGAMYLYQTGNGITMRSDFDMNEAVNGQGGAFVVDGGNVTGTLVESTETSFTNNKASKDADVDVHVRDGGTFELIT